MSLRDEISMMIITCRIIIKEKKNSPRKKQNKKDKSKTRLINVTSRVCLSSAKIWSKIWSYLLLDDWHCLSLSHTPSYKLVSCATEYTNTRLLQWQQWYCHKFEQVLRLGLQVSSLDWHFLLLAIMIDTGSSIGVNIDADSCWFLFVLLLSLLLGHFTLSNV